MSISVDMTSCVTIVSSLVCHYLDEGVLLSVWQPLFVCLQSRYSTFAGLLSVFVQVFVVPTVVFMFVFGLFGAHCAEMHNVFSPLASVFPVFNGVCHCLVAHVFV